MAEPFPRGRILWHELLTTDPDAAATFYTKVVGWGVMRWEQDPSYRMWTVKSTPVGGLMRLPDEVRQRGVPPHWMMYVGVPDVRSAVRQATAMGARTHMEPREVPTVGTFAILADPQGAAFAVYHPAGEPVGHDGPFKPGEFSWHELATTDWRAAWDFYRALFGWEKSSEMDMGPAGTYWIFGREGKMIGGMYNKPPEMPAPPHWLAYAMVRSADASAETTKRLGGQVLNGPMDVPGEGRIAQCLDPQGGTFAVHSVKVAVKPAARPKKAKPAAKARKKPARAAKAKKRAARKAPARSGARRRVPKRPARRVAKRRPAKKRPARRRRR